MYLNFYQLTREPFHVTPDPDFLYLSESHKQALAAIIYGVKQRKGFITITGPVGSGKTTILRAFLKQADPAEIKVIYVFNPTVPFSKLIVNLCHEFDLDPPPNDVPRAVEMLYLALADHYGTGRTVVLLIDEAQNMPVETLENMRMLSNFETTQDKLLQIVLAGQPELEEVLRKSSLYQLRQRRAIRASIAPLTRGESVNYIKYRLSKAGGDTGLFKGNALKMIWKQARGIPRMLNMICDNALATGYAYGKKRIDAGLAREAIRDLEGTVARRMKLGAAAAAAAMLVALFAAALFVPGFEPFSVFTREQSPQSMPVQPKDEARDIRVGQENRIRQESGEKRESAPGQEGSVKQGYGQEQANAAPQEKRGRGIKAPGGTVRIARRGDTVVDLIGEVYGIREPRRVQSIVVDIMKNNPNITNANYILEGQRIFFPALKSSTVEASP